MKKLILLLLLTTLGFAQAPTKNANGFFAGTGTMQASAIGQFDSTSKGFLFPRMTTMQRNAIASPATSLVIFNTTTGAYNYWDGDSWETFGGGSTPTLEQILTAGDTATDKNIILGGIDPLIQLSNADGTIAQHYAGGSSFSGAGSSYINDEEVYINSGIPYNQTHLYGGKLQLGSAASMTRLYSLYGFQSIKFAKGSSAYHEINYTDPTGTRTHTLQDASGTIAHLSDIPTVDTNPTDGSSNAVSSNGVFDALATKADLAGSTSVDFQVPTTPSGANSAISRNYLDNALTGLTWKNAVKCSTTANHSLSGTANVDGVTIPAGTRVLVRFQTTTADNGIYITAAGAWTRATDCDSATEINETTVLVTSGTLYKNTQWTQSNTITTVGTDAITFAQVAGAGTYTNGTGIDLTANVFSVSSAVTTNSGTQTLTNKTIDGASNTLSNIAQSSITNLNTDLSGKQATLVSGTNIKTIESNSLLGSGNIDLTKTDVGLANVDNTSDANKPVSTAQQTAIDAKVQNSLSTSTTIAPSATSVNTALALKVDKARTIFQTKTSITGVTSETVICTMKVDAGLYSANDGFALNIDFYKSATTSTSAFRVYIGTTASATTTQIGQLNVFSNTTGTGFLRFYSLNAGKIESNVGGTTSSNSNLNNNASAGLSATCNPANDFWITITGAPSVSSEIYGLYLASITPLK